MALIFRHILPNSIGPIITSSMIAIPSAIFAESFLAYIGLGLQAPEPSIGVMLSQGQKVLLHYPTQVVFPACRHLSSDDLFQPVWKWSERCL